MIDYLELIAHNRQRAETLSVRPLNLKSKQEIGKALLCLHEAEVALRDPEFKTKASVGDIVNAKIGEAATRLSAVEKALGHP